VQSDSSLVAEAKKLQLHEFRLLGDRGDYRASLVIMLRFPSGNIALVYYPNGTKTGLEGNEKVLDDQWSWYAYHEGFSGMM